MTDGDRKSWFWRLELVPYPMPRPRRGKGGAVYTPAEARTRVAELRAELRARWGDAAPLEGPVAVTVRFVRLAGRDRRRDGDGDNYEKALFDAGTGVLWVDDGQIVRCSWSLDEGDAPAIELGVNRYT